MIAHHRLKRIILAMLLFLIFPIAWVTRTFLCSNHVNICIYHILTNKSCPFCGLTRAIACATHGDFNSAFIHHPLWWLAVVIILCIAFVSFFDAVRKTDYLSFSKNFLLIPFWVIIIVLLILALFRLLIFC